MAKGYSGESCAEAIMQSIQVGEIIPYNVLFDRVRKKGDWSDSTITQHLMSCIVNLPPARFHWEGREPFLLLHLDGRYELFDSSRHPNTFA